MIETANQILDFLIANYALYMVVTMSIIVSFTVFILSLIKKPIKAITKKIPNERFRKLANKVFILIAFGLSAGAWFMLQVISPAYFHSEAEKILLTGAFSIVLYALGDGVINNNTAMQMVNEIISDVDEKKDNKTDSKTKDKGNSAVNEFLKKVK